MPKIVYTAAQGLVQQAGSGVSFENLPFTPSVTALVTAQTASLPGIYTISGTAASNVTLPPAATYPGGVFVFRSLSPYPHFITGSEVAPNRVFTLGAASATGTGGITGSRITLNNIVGSSVMLTSDGVNYLITSASGSLTVAGG